MDTFSARLAAGGTIVLDGGLSTELERLGADLRDGLWSAKVLLGGSGTACAPPILASFEAGAEVAITASYQASFEGYARARSRRDGRREALAAERRPRAWRRARSTAVAGCGLVGPYGAVPGNGADTRRLPARRARASGPSTGSDSTLDAAGADLLAVETIPRSWRPRRWSAADRCRQRRPVGLLHLPRWRRPARRNIFVEAVSMVSASQLALARRATVHGTAARALAEIEAARRSSETPSWTIYPNRGATWDAERRSWAGP